MHIRHPDRALDFPVTGALVGLTVLINAGGLFVSLDSLVPGPSWASEPWGLVTSIFPHADPLHFGMNVLWIWILGVMVELRFGTLETAGLAVLFAVGSSAGQLWTGTVGIGLSGVVYGFAGLLAVMSRRDRRMASALPRAVETGFVLWIFVGLLLTRADIYPIGNAAHIAGGLLGGLAGLALAKPHYRVQADRERWVARLGAGLTAIATLTLVVAAGRTPLAPAQTAHEKVHVTWQAVGELELVLVDPHADAHPSVSERSQPSSEGTVEQGGDEQRRRRLDEIRETVAEPPQAAWPQIAAPDQDASRAPLSSQP